jgi:SAM-dependent methyltransferase
MAGEQAQGRALAGGQLRAKLAQEPAGRSEPVRVLSIGSGVGYMENVLLEEMPELELHVNEPSTVSMRWLRRRVPNERIYIGLPPACLPADVQYDMIYLSTVDYGIPTREFAHLLGELRAQLAPGGEIILLSASLLEEDSAIGSFVNAIKILIRAALHFLGIRRQQFWGWRRTRAEYRELFKQAGFTKVQDGWLEDGFETYWIRGR